MKLSIITAIVYVSLVAGFVSMQACQSTTAQSTIVATPAVEYFRVTILEDRSTSWVAIPVDMVRVYRAGDHVWVNLMTNRIDDVSDSTMECRLHMTRLQCIKYDLPANN